MPTLYYSAEELAEEENRDGSCHDKTKEKAVCGETVMHKSDTYSLYTSRYLENSGEKKRGKKLGEELEVVSVDNGGETSMIVESEGVDRNFEISPSRKKKKKSDKEFGRQPSQNDVDTCDNKVLEAKYICALDTMDNVETERDDNAQRNNTRKRKHTGDYHEKPEEPSCDRIIETTDRLEIKLGDNEAKGKKNKKGNIKHDCHEQLEGQSDDTTDNDEIQQVDNEAENGKEMESKANRHVARPSSQADCSSFDNTMFGTFNETDTVETEQDRSDVNIKKKKKSKKKKRIHGYDEKTGGYSCDERTDSSMLDTTENVVAEQDIDETRNRRRKKKNRSKEKFQADNDQIVKQNREYSVDSKISEKNTAGDSGPEDEIDQLDTTDNVDTEQNDKTSGKKRKKSKRRNYTDDDEEKGQKQSYYNQTDVSELDTVDTEHEGVTKSKKKKKKKKSSKEMIRRTTSKK